MTSFPAICRSARIICSVALVLFLVSALSSVRMVVVTAVSIVFVVVAFASIAIRRFQGIPSTRRSWRLHRSSMIVHIAIVFLW